MNDSLPGPGESTAVVTVKLPETMLRELDEVARRTGVTRSAVIRTALREYLDRLRRLDYSLLEPRGPGAETSVRLELD